MELFCRRAVIADKPQFHLFGGVLGVFKHKSFQDLILALEVMIERRTAEIESLRDVQNGRLSVALLLEDIGGFREDFLTHKLFSKGGRLSSGFHILVISGTSPPINPFLAFGA